MAPTATGSWALQARREACMGWSWAAACRGGGISWRPAAYSLLRLVVLSAVSDRDNKTASFGNWSLFKPQKVLRDTSGDASNWISVFNIHGSFKIWRENCQFKNEIDKNLYFYFLCVTVIFCYCSVSLTLLPSLSTSVKWLSRLRVSEPVLCTVNYVFCYPFCVLYATG